MIASHRQNSHLRSYTGSSHEVWKSLQLVQMQITKYLTLSSGHNLNQTVKNIARSVVDTLGLHYVLAWRYSAVYSETAPQF